MLELICASCKKQLFDFGGILLSPPGVDGKVFKFHICKECYKILENTMLRMLIEHCEETNE